MNTYDEYRQQYQTFVRQTAPHETVELSTTEEVTFDLLVAPLERR